MAGVSHWNEKVIAEFRANNGTVEAAGFGRRLVLLHHVGARSGTERVTPLFALREGTDTWFVAASKAGTDDNPAWLHNLLAQPDTRIETPEAGEVAVHASELPPDQRDVVWERFKAASPGFC